ncbi:MAG TPA: 1,4-alpha-glucan branching enzyme, partial [Isosphaeraceae bacterium]|nr:1,4-alpha-glucan branching enzyme [Isosphaeraceae bacterium]
MPVRLESAPTTLQSDIDLIVYGNHWDPFSVLGLHELPSDNGKLRTWIVRAFLPEAHSTWLVDLVRGEPGDAVPMEMVHPDGFFVAVLGDRPDRFPYRIRVENHEGYTWEFVDP